MTPARQMQDFVDALRVVLGLRPLYRLDRRELVPCYERRAFSDMLIATGDGNRQVRALEPSTARPGNRGPRLELEPQARRLSGNLRGARRLDGQRVGAAFTSAKHARPR